MNEINPQLTDPEISLDESPTLKRNRISDLASWVKSRKVEEIECHTPDFAGIARGKIMPTAKWLTETQVRLPSSIFIATITGGWAELDTEPAWIHDPDFILKPDILTATSIPWTGQPSIQIIHDPVTLDGKPVEYAPRNVLRKVLKLYENEGWKPIVSPELEFYLTKPNSDPNEVLEAPVGRSGRTQRTNQAFSMQGIDEYEGVIEHIYDFAEAQGLEIDTIIQEYGAGQLEVNLTHGDALDKADEVFLFKRTIKEAALRTGSYATFMAKPMAGQPGNAMHVHQSVVDIETGNNIFSDDNGDMTELFLNFIAGQQQFSYAASLVYAPYVNSYRRLVPDMSAPINAEWGYDNRSVGLRVPRSNAANRRVENRFIGADTNPYLAIAASLASGYIGMKRGLKARDHVTGDSFAKGRDLPYSLLEAIEVFRQSEEMMELLGEKFVQMYSQIKSDEYDAFMQVISPWEREHLLMNV